MSPIRRALSSTVSPADAANLQKMSARLTLENTYLSYTRNAVISTVAGGALVQYHKSQGRPPLAGSGLLLMGGIFMYSGSALYCWHTFQLRAALEFGPWSLFGSLLNAAFPTVLWSVSLACLLDETPSWLLEGLRLVEARLPSAVRTSLFLDPPALYPLCRLLQGVIVHEDNRLATSRRHAAGAWSLTKPARAPLTDLDVATIIARRRERLDLLRTQLYDYAKSTRAVPTAVAVPLLDKLRVEVEQLQKVLEADMEPQLNRRLFWWLATRLSSEHRSLRHEHEEVRALLRRIAAVQFASAEFAARGQEGVRPALPEEQASAKAVQQELKLK